jgi:hypothetical protein
MKIFTFAVVLLSSAIAIACPDLSGSYQFVQGAHRGTLNVKQNACESVVMTENWIAGEGVPAFSISVFSADGKAYAGNGFASTPADDDTEMFHVAQYTKSGLRVTTYRGSMRDCNGRYNYSSPHGHCSKLESNYELSKHSNGLTLREVGSLWSEEGAEERVSVLERR